MNKITVENASVDFYKSEENGITIYRFDTSRCGPPEPMVNAMAGLQLLDDNAKLIMINHKTPAGLFPRIQEEFDYEVGQTEDGKVQVIFTRKKGVSSSTDFTQNSCSG